LKRTWPITSSMMLIGASVGVVTPAMPFVVENMGLTTSEYGLVVLAFALARMAANVPSAIAIERHGRRPYMIHSMALIAVGVGGIGIATSFEELYLCRLMTGVGVSLLGCAATLMMTDISTPLNRASTMAPIMSGFTAGMALGPAMGGVMVDSIGLGPTFYLVGASYLGVAGVNRMVLSETQR
jgi:MFS family permease